MDGRAVVLKVVGDVNNNVVAPIGDDCGARNGTVDRENDTLNTVGSSSPVLDTEPVFPGNTGVGNVVVVICRDVVVSPAGSVRSAIHASFGQGMVQGVRKRKARSSKGPRDSSQCPKRGKHGE